MSMGFDFEKFKLSLAKIKEESYLELQNEIAQLKVAIERVLTKVLESSASLSRSSYSGLEMH